MNNPVTYNFPDQYRNDGLNSFTITLNYPNGDPVPLVGSSVLMQMKNSLGTNLWEFSSELEGDHRLTISANTIQFPEIKSWSTPATKYYYDLQVTDSAGFVRTYLKGTWKVNQDLTN